MKRSTFEANLRAEAERWKGAPFVSHGATRYGADCLGSICGILRGAGIELPPGDGMPYESDWFLHDRTRNRYLEGLLKIGREIEQDPMPGDIIAFWSSHQVPKVTHSGLYLGSGDMVHCRRACGVQITRVTEIPWAKVPKTWIRLRAVEERLDA